MFFVQYDANRVLKYFHTISGLTAFTRLTIQYFETMFIICYIQYNLNA